MEPTSIVTLSTLLRIMWRAHRRTEQGEHVFIKHIKNVLWLIASLDKTLIHRLALCIALWSCTETIILTSNRLESIEVHYMDTNPRMFSSKTIIYFRLKKGIHTSWITWGWVNYQEIFIWKWTNPLRLEYTTQLGTDFKALGIILLVAL